MYETFVGTVEDLTARVIVAPGDIESPSDLFERARQWTVCQFRLCYDLYAAFTSNNSCDIYCRCISDIDL
ncbi:hypothetical protein TNCV_4856821 [Trichonephila clavipes]|nr:hypothetical protein TNCV_4856821 [Trichonephila clavipes]